MLHHQAVSPYLRGALDHLSESAATVRGTRRAVDGLPDNIDAMESPDTTITTSKKRGRKADARNSDRPTGPRGLGERKAQPQGKTDTGELGHGIISIAPAANFNDCGTAEGLGTGLNNSRPPWLSIFDIIDGDRQQEAGGNGEPDNGRSSCSRPLRRHRVAQSDADSDEGQPRAQPGSTNGALPAAGDPLMWPNPLELDARGTA